MSISAIILGAGAETHAGAAARPEPRSMLKDLKGRRVLDWILSGLVKAKINKITFVGGYRIDDVGDSFPELSYIYNPDWQNSGVLASLYHARSEITQETVVVYGDIVFRDDVVVKLLAKAQEGITIAVDSTSDHLRSSSVGIRKNMVCQSEGRVIDIGFLDAASGRNAEFIGLMHIAPQTAVWVRSFLERQYIDWDTVPFEQASEIGKAYLTDLIRYALRQGISVRTVDVSNRWAEMDQVDSLARFVLGTKSETLERLASILKSGRFCEQRVFTVGDWIVRKDQIIEELSSFFSPKKVVIRSSALAEDGWHQSMAGAFESVLNIDSVDSSQIEDAVTRVVASYRKADSSAGLGNQILVQEMVRDVFMHGVVFTRDLQNDAPYYVINFDDETDRTDTVTSGETNDIRTVVVSRLHRDKVQDPRLVKLLDVVQEIEAVTGCAGLDIEFAINADSEVFVLQARRLTLSGTMSVDDDHQVAAYIDEATRRFAYHCKSQPFVFGLDTIWGDMTDWNPAEMISPHPKPLAISLYGRLITDSSWRVARGRIGYHNPDGVRLMRSIGGHPYIDVRASFNNLIPCGLPASLAEKVINIYLERLKRNPEFHDKVEFEVCVTCFDFDHARHHAEFVRDGLTDEEVAVLMEHLRVISDRIISSQIEPIDDVLKQFETLNARRTEFVASCDETDRIFVTVDRLLHDCVQFGVIPFSILARYGFIATSLLRSLVRRSIISDAEYNTFLGSVESVATELVRDVDLVASGELELPEFLKQYGHLRPGTYDITSLSYAEAPEAYFAEMRLEKRDIKNQTTSDASILDKHRVAIEKELSAAGFSIDASTLLEFCRKAIAAREFGKFEFTKSVSAIFDLLVRYGEATGLSRDDISHLDIHEMLAIGLDHPSVKPPEWLKERANVSRQERRFFGRLRMPHLIAKPDDLYVIELSVGRPNFVTNDKVGGTVIVVEPDTAPGNLAGKIALIESADPGYDWIFAHKIAGLITRYGGAASHMTIRASEFGLPAAIGCGEMLYEKIKRASFVELDCSGKHVRVH